MTQLMVRGRKASNNRKETHGRAVRKQYSPLYATKRGEKDHSDEIVSQWREEGVPSYEIERRFRQKRLALHI